MNVTPLDPPFFLKKKNIYLFLAALGLHCCAWAFFLVEASGAILALAFYCGAFSCGVLALGTWASAVAVHGLNCPMAYGVFPIQGSNLCPLSW